MATAKTTKNAKNGKEKAPSRKNKGFFASLKAFLKDSRVHKAFGLFLSLFSVFLLVSFISFFFSFKDDEAEIKSSTYEFLFGQGTYKNLMGRFGAYFSDLFIARWFGVAAFAFILLFFVSGIRIFLNYSLLPIGKMFRHAIFWIIWVSTTLGLIFIQYANLNFLGGGFGYFTAKWLSILIGEPGLGLLLFFTLTVFLFFSYDMSFLKNIRIKMPQKQEPDEETDEEETNTGKTNRRKDPDTTEDLSSDKKVVEFDIDTPDKKKKTEPVNTLIIEEEEEEDYDEEDITVIPNNNDVEFTVETTQHALITHDDEASDETDIVHIPLSEPYDPTLDLPDYKYPGPDLLDDYGNTKGSVQSDELNQNKNKIVDTLKNYSIAITKIVATIGPTVTLYEIIPAPGVRISRIKNLEDDIALSLSALGIRIIAPIPGKGTIGIEVPNQNPEIVSMKSIINSDKFRNNKFDLPIGLGKTISDESFVTDLTKMPHLLMAGATGQGKSVGLNAVLASLLYHKHPSQVKFVLVDPKKVELSLFTKIERHFLAKLPGTDEAIITDTRKVVCTLNSLCVEMDNRYDLLKDAQVRNIKEYNAKFIARRLNPENGHHFLPYIVLFVDEFADLIMTAGKEIEAPIARLAQLARAIGIHLIIATQRPSVNIITGTIKANFPARLAFRVTSKIDSRTILDTGGADQLIGRGDMLLSTGNELIRLQCAFIDTHEVERITDFIGSQRGYPDAFQLPEFVDDQSEGNGPADTGEKDAMFEDAARLIVTHQQGSTSLIQRKLKLGYNRAGRIIDQLEAAGIVGPFEGSKAREVKIKDLLHLEQYLNDLNNK